MIRLRIERPENFFANLEGLVWYEEGNPVGRVIIEEWNEYLNPLEEIWLPVEVIDEG